MTVIMAPLSAGNNVIGIAWLADAKFYLGGMCSRYFYKPYTPSPPQDAGYYSFNTLVVSQLHGGERLVDAVMSVTVVHELGHSFGAEHDEVKSNVHTL